LEPWLYSDIGAPPNRTDYPRVEHHETTRRTRLRRWTADWSIRSASITAGVGLLLMSVLAGFGNFVALDGLVTEGDASLTAQNITASQGLFRLGSRAWW
jgi:hypothetical protein